MIDRGIHIDYAVSMISGTVFFIGIFASDKFFDRYMEAPLIVRLLPLLIVVGICIYMRDTRFTICVTVTILVMYLLGRII